MCNWNIHGLSDEKLVVLEKYLRNFDMLIFQETWHRNEDAVHDIDGFTSYHYVRPNQDVNAVRGAGGISVFVKHHLKPHITPLKSTEDYIVWFKVKETLLGNVNPLAIGIVYFPPEGSKVNSTRNDYFFSLEQQISQFNGLYDIMLVGDFNSRTKDLPDYDLYESKQNDWWAAAGI